MIYCKTCGDFVGFPTDGDVLPGLEKCEFCHIEQKCYSASGDALPFTTKVSKRCWGTTKTYIGGWPNFRRCPNQGSVRVGDKWYCLKHDPNEKED